LSRGWNPFRLFNCHNGITRTGITLNIASIQGEGVAVGKASQWRVINSALKLNFTGLLQKNTTSIQTTVAAFNASAFNGGWNLGLDGYHIIEVMKDWALSQSFDVYIELNEGFGVLPNESGL